MSEAWGCMSAYQKLTDGVLEYIMMSNETGLETSKNLLSRIHNRDLYKCVYESPPEMVFISMCYYKIDGTEMPTTLMLLQRKSWRNTSFHWWREVWAHSTSLTISLVIELHALSKETQRSCICVCIVSILSLSTVLIFEFRIVPMVRYVFLFILVLREYRFSHLFVISFK